MFGRNLVKCVQIRLVLFMALFVLPHIQIAVRLRMRIYPHMVSDGLPRGFYLLCTVISRL
uniref:Uncharacterized protein n=1 Tax=Setaria italica TaxID=4555 RepID=K4A3X5_SETIT